MLRRVLLALLFGTLITAATYPIDLGCSCGPARGFPFAYVHPYQGCITSRWIVGADSNNRYSPVLNFESLAYNILIWTAAVFFISRHLRPLPAGRRPRCNYELRSHPDTAPCPEGGATVTKPSSTPTAPAQPHMTQQDP